MTLMPPPPPRYGSCPTTTTPITTLDSILRRPSVERNTKLLATTLLDDNTELSVLPDCSGDLDKDRNNINVSSSSNFGRLRAGSYDERQTRRVKFAPGIIMNNITPLLQHPQQQTEEYDDRRCIRPRSASCSNSSSESNSSINSNTAAARGGGICEAIVEEEGYVEPMFSMDL